MTRSVTLSAVAIYRLRVVLCLQPRFSNLGVASELVKPAKGLLMVRLFVVSLMHQGAAHGACICRFFDAPRGCSWCVYLLFLGCTKGLLMVRFFVVS